MLSAFECRLMLPPGECFKSCRDQSTLGFVQLAALEICADDETNWVAALVDLKLRIDSGDFTGFEPVSPIENDTFA